MSSPRSSSIITLLGATIVPAAAFASSAAEGGSHSVIQNIAVSIVAAAALGLLMRLLRQPLLLGYIGAGVVIGPIGLRLITDHSEIITLAEIGLILLLFMIGLEIDLKKMRAAGKWVIVPGLLQFPICVAAAYGLFGLLERHGVDLGSGSYARLYVAIAVSLSSTMIVVKLLFDKMELDTLPGRVTVGILVFQDVWAIIVLAIQPNLNHPEVLGLLRTFGAGGLLVAVTLVASRYVLPAVFRSVAQIPELMLILSLGWCFLVALVASHPRVGLSMEMGALIAGVSLATFPYNLDVVAKAVSIRDFFITLFFVALGMQIPLPDLDLLLVALVVVGVALAVRVVGIFGVLYGLASGHRAALLATINLSQVSEFSLVILTMGVGFGHIEGDTLTLLIWVFAVLAVASTYLVAFSHPLQAVISRVLTTLRIEDLGGARDEAAAGERHRVVLLGFFRIASAMLEEMRERYPSLVSTLQVIDFNPRMKERLAALGVAYTYGDVSNPDTLHHAGIHHAELVACTIPDGFLKGTSNHKLLQTLKGMCPHATVIVTAETTEQASELYAAGADYVLEPSQVAGDWLASLVYKGLATGLTEEGAAARHDLSARRQILG